VASQKTMKALHRKPNTKMKTMDKNERTLNKIQEEFIRFERTTEELHFLKQVTQDLKNFKEMLKFKKYD